MANESTTKTSKAERIAGLELDFNNYRAIIWASKIGSPQHTHATDRCREISETLAQLRAR
jgi:hypothetical protein